MARPKLPGQSTVQEAREAYFAGKISAEEYLRRVLPNPEQERAAGAEESTAEQFRRIRQRLTQKRR